jgi:hypothetical protein
MDRADDGPGRIGLPGIFLKTTCKGGVDRPTSVPKPNRKWRSKIKMSSYRSRQTNYSNI